MGFRIASLELTGWGEGSVQCSAQVWEVQLLLSEGKPGRFVGEDAELGLGQIEF